VADELPAPGQTLCADHQDDAFLNMHDGRFLDSGKKPILHDKDLMNGLHLTTVSSVTGPLVYCAEKECLPFKGILMVKNHRMLYLCIGPLSNWHRALQRHTGAAAFHREPRAYSWLS
jgi:hypothetical protein